HLCSHLAPGADRRWPGLVAAARGPEQGLRSPRAADRPRPGTPSLSPRVSAAPGPRREAPQGLAGPITTPELRKQTPLNTKRSGHLHGHAREGLALDRRCPVAPSVLRFRSGATV